MNKIETMGINDDMFIELRRDFDITLQRLFEKMNQAGETEPRRQKPQPNRSAGRRRTRRISHGNKS